MLALLRKYEKCHTSELIQMVNGMTISYPCLNAGWGCNWWIKFPTYIRSVFNDYERDIRMRPIYFGCECYSRFTLARFFNGQHYCGLVNLN